MDNMLSSIENASQFYCENGSFDRNKMDEARLFLSDKGLKLDGIEDHKRYVKLLGDYRGAAWDMAKHLGGSFRETIQSMLGTGEDGIYSNEMRFLFELIQNVDDCEYPEGETAKLAIHFSGNRPEIVLEYNEVGFSVQNVFAISGIAEHVKNIKDGDAHIGEKGIGFKAVFGIAKEVLIESGFFSFSFSSDNIVTPKPAYTAKSEFVKGTRLTITLDSQEKSSALFSELIARYSGHEQLLTQNPILFLNKLSSVCITSETGEFAVEVNRSNKRTVPSGLEVDDVEISSVRAESANDGKRDVFSIRGKEYVRDICYDHDCCVSRYGEGTELQEKVLTLCAFVPDRQSYAGNENGIPRFPKGKLYSFFPTQIDCKLPCAIHAPFKLSGSREFVDSQKDNVWFMYTSKALSNFLVAVYHEIAAECKTLVVDYLPEKNVYLFEGVGDKADNLKKDDLFKSNILLDQDIFFCQDGGYRNAARIYCFDEWKYVVEDIAKTYSHHVFKNEVISYQKRQAPYRYGRSWYYRTENVPVRGDVERDLFLMPLHVNPVRFGITTAKNMFQSVFTAAMCDSNCAQALLNALEQAIDAKRNDDENFKFNVRKCLDECSEDSLRWSSVAVKELFNHGELYKDVLDCLIDKIKNKNTPSPVLKDVSVEASETLGLDLDGNVITVDDLGPNCANYFGKIKCARVVLDCFPSAEFLPLGNCFVYGGGSMEDSLAELTLKCDRNDFFSARMAMKKSVRKINNADSSLNPKEFVTLVNRVHSEFRHQIGEVCYEKLISLLNKSGEDNRRYILELIQNADDSIFADGVVARFSVRSSDQGSFETISNEIGFRREDVAAISSIGSSTKLNQDKEWTIGEKGVGFKSVFAIADSVKIDSNDFHFELTRVTPTVPTWIPGREYNQGTRMLFEVRTDGAIPNYDEDDLVRILLCVRQLRDVVYLGHNVHIVDDQNRRQIYVDGVAHNFDKFVYEFDVPDEVLAERQKDNASISKRQHITFYSVDTDSGIKSCYLYAGMPTEIKVNVPLAIDAPFELTTARDRVLQSNWNAEIRKGVYAGLVALMVSKRDVLRISALKFVKFQSGYTAIFTSDYLNDYDLLTQVKGANLLPLVSSNAFANALENAPKRVPLFVCRKLSEREMTLQSPVVDERGVVEPCRDVLDALGLSIVGPSVLMDGIRRIWPREIANDLEFRKEFYKYLRDSVLRNDEFHLTISSLPSELKEFVPVYRRDDSGNTIFISSDESEIFTQQGVDSSPDSSYYVLNENFVTASVLSDIIGKRIDEMDDDRIHQRYEKMLEGKLLSPNSNEELYSELLRMYSENCNAFAKALPSVLLRVPGNVIPLKNGLGIVVREQLWLLDADKKGPAGSVLQGLTPHEECRELSNLCRGLATYQSISALSELKVSVQLSREDITDIKRLCEDHAIEILRDLVRRGCISNDLADEFGMPRKNRKEAPGGIAAGQYDISDELNHKKDNVFMIEITRMNDRTCCCTVYDPKDGVLYRLGGGKGIAGVRHVTQIDAVLGDYATGSLFSGTFVPMDVGQEPHREDSFWGIKPLSAHVEDSQLHEFFEKTGVSAVGVGLGISGSATPKDDYRGTGVSIVTLKPRSIEFFGLRERYSKNRNTCVNDLRIDVVSCAGDIVLQNLKVNDFRFYKGHQDPDPEVLSRAKACVDAFANNELELYLRFGLTRPFSPHKGEDECYWLQVDGLHFFAKDGRYLRNFDLHAE